jgi:hypothetical protein
MLTIRSLLSDTRDCLVTSGPVNSGIRKGSLGTSFIFAIFISPSYESTAGVMTPEADFSGLKVRAKLYSGR